MNYWRETQNSGYKVVSGRARVIAKAMDLALSRKRSVTEVEIATAFVRKVSEVNGIKTVGENDGRVKW